MNNLNLRKIAELTGGKLFGGRDAAKVEVSSVVSDSREVVKGCLFLCIKGERTDGHSFANAAVDAGAAACLMERKVKNYRGAYILVDSVKNAAQVLAQYYRNQLNLKVVGITGSVGKTSTKEFIAAVLSRRMRVHKTQGNHNNEWGVPFTIFGISEDDEAAVIEIGVDDFGQMESRALMVRPDIAVITNIGESHLEHFGTREGIYKEKSDIFRYMDSNGSVILNGDDDILREVGSVKGKKPLFFGFGANSAIRAENIKDHGFDGTEFDIAIRDGGGRLAIHIKLPVCGVHMIYSALAAAAVGIKMGMPLVRIKEGLESVKNIPGHNGLIRTDKYVIMDDCYNASPKSVAAALDTLKASPGRSVAILGDMLELGQDSEKFHFQTGKKAGLDGTDLIICIGPLSEKTYMGARMNTDKQVEYYRTLEDGIAALPELVKRGDTILVKASNSMKFRKIVDFLCKDMR